MINKDILKKKILYRSYHRGTKEMDLLLGKFVNKYINLFNDIELKELESLLKKDDDILHNLYFKNKDKIDELENEVIKKFKNFKP
tara:strand:- start:78 stop:332 length:255 start_codon:yes stop_codon:yes gene_type:complete